MRGRSNIQVGGVSGSYSTTLEEILKLNKHCAMKEKQLCNKEKTLRNEEIYMLHLLFFTMQNIYKMTRKRVSNSTL